MRVSGIDMHLHTTASDGSDSPEEVVKKAQQNGLSAIAITDHDTVSGVSGALWEAASKGIEVVPGAEFSVNFSPVMHILGLYLDLNNTELKSTLHRLDRNRLRLIAKSFKKVNDYGIYVNPKQILEHKKAITIVNLKNYLLENRLIESQSYLEIQLSKVTDEWKSVLPSITDCISLIHLCGGLAILAHPKLLCCDDKKLLNILVYLKQCGLDGVEVIHPLHTNKDKQSLMQWADKLGLLYSGGSDYHGNGDRLTVASTNGSNGVFVPYSYLENMKQRLKGR